MDPYRMMETDHDLASGQTGGYMVVGETAKLEADNACLREALKLAREALEASDRWLVSLRQWADPTGYVECSTNLERFDEVIYRNAAALEAIRGAGS